MEINRRIVDEENGTKDGKSEGNIIIRKVDGTKDGIEF